MPFGTQIATAKHAVNRLINGGFYRVLLPIDDEIVEVMPGEDQPRSAVIDRENNAASPSYRVPSQRPKETSIANWYVYGVPGSVDIRPKDPDRANVPVRGLHGPTPARFALFEAGEIVVEQPVREFWGLLDRAVTFSYFMRQGNGSPTVSVEVDYGTGEVEVLHEVSAKTFPTGGQHRLHFTPRFDAQQFVIRFRLSGAADESAYLGEAMLQLGTVKNPRYTDDMAAQERPRNTAVFYAGDPEGEIPPGYVKICESEDRFYYPTAGDARVDGLTRGADGGQAEHNHGGKTGDRTRSTSLHHTGASQVDHHHKHVVTDAEVDPPWVKILTILKV